MTKKHFIGVLIAFLCSLTTSWAQNEQDFASRYMMLYGRGTSMECTTISPLMLERMMQLPDVEGNNQTRAILSQLKSIRMAHNVKQSETTALYNKAIKLAHRNSARYKVYAERANKRLYVRRRGKYIVEMVLLLKANRQFQLINLTGNMTEDFLNQLLKA